MLTIACKPCTCHQIYQLDSCGSIANRLRLDFAANSVVREADGLFWHPPDIGPLLFTGLALASLVTAFIGIYTGAAGGVILLAIMAIVMPPAAVIPVHTS